MRRYLPLAIIGAVFLLAIGGGLMLFRWKEPPSAPTAPLVPVVPAVPTAVPTGVPNTAPTVQAKLEEAPRKLDAALPHIRGGASAPVTIEEYGDFQCIPCAALFPTLSELEADYGERLRVVFRHKPLQQHEHAVLAACAAEAAGLQGRFWEMHDLLFQNSFRWTKGVDTVGPDAHPSLRLQSKVLAMDSEVRDVFARYAEILKLDVERFKTDMDSDEVKARVEADRARGDALGIDRTPTLYINGNLFHISSLNVDDFHVAIDAALKGKEKGDNVSSTPSASPEQSQ